jgi:GNAT superfamily N-acetyltransferase
MSPLPQVRQAQLEDVPLLERLAAATWWATYQEYLSREQLDYMFQQLFTPEALRRQMGEGGHVFLLLEVAGAPVGFASFFPKAGEERVIRLSKLYLLPGNQQRGLGRALLAAVEAQARGRRAEVLELNVNRYNPARRFYERLGYAVVQEVDLPMGPFWLNDFVMQKRL